MPRARGYAPFDVTPESAALVRRIVSHAQAAGPGHVAVLDLDGCLFDTRPRQIHIFHELAARPGMEPLARVRAEHLTDWSIPGALRRAGLPEDFVAAHTDTVRRFWAERFFASRSLVHDHAMPGAPALVRALWDAGLHLVYLTGRDEGMRPGTEEALRRFAFPFDAPRTGLVMKPDAQADDTTFKEGALAAISELGRVVLYLDNEPANVNVFTRVHPEALVVFVETDHSPRPDEPDPRLPWLRSFLTG
jgi:phosphoglycolate phosphatase-like HAD superfamily hydrolase